VANFPKRIQTSQTSERGINFVSSVFNDEYGWLFRKDIVLEDGSVTGKSLALQVKTGKSFMKEKTAAGIVFRGEQKHLNYYLNHSTPVIILICDIDNAVCYWEHFDIDRTDGTSIGWSMTIPFSQELDHESKNALTLIAGPAEDLTRAARQQWEMNKLLKNSGHIEYWISRVTVEKRDTSKISSFFKRLEKNMGVCKATQGRISISFSGYGDDPRELWEIDEVRNWFRSAFPLVKYWFYFLDPKDPDRTLWFIFTLLCDTSWEVKGQKLSIAIEKMEEITRQCFGWQNELTDRLRMSLKENDEISARVWEALGFEKKQLK
jgi:hypothetical protein